MAGDEWKSYKTVANRDDLKADDSDDINAFNQISVSNMTDDKFHPDISIWKMEAYIPEPDSRAIMEYYNDPTLRTQFDSDTMSAFYVIPISNKVDTDPVSQNEEDVVIVSKLD